MLGGASERVRCVGIVASLALGCGDSFLQPVRHTSAHPDRDPSRLAAGDWASEGRVPILNPALPARGRPTSTRPSAQTHRNGRLSAAARVVQPFAQPFAQMQTPQRGRPRVPLTENSAKSTQLRGFPALSLRFV